MAAPSVSSPPFGSGVTSATSGVGSASSPSLIYITSQDLGLTFSTNVLRQSPHDQKQANYQRQAVLNRSSDLLTYSNSTNVTLDVVVELGAWHEKSYVDKIQDVMQAFRALVHPMQSGIKGPPVCEVTLGGDKLFQQWKCLCANVGRAYELEAGFTEDLKCRVAVCNLSFIGIEDDSVDATDVSSGVDYKDPNFYDYSNSGQIASVASQVMGQVNNAIGVLSSLGIEVGQGGVSFGTGFSGLGTPTSGGGRTLSF